jgi:hypothetical protein
MFRTPAGAFKNDALSSMMRLSGTNLRASSADANGVESRRADALQ